MSDDKSMFKKMKDKITDEVSSATNKLQNIQIIDQLASSIGQQVTKNDTMPHQRLPEISEQSDLPTNSRFSLIEDNQLGDCDDDDDELDSGVSPQHQLFNERSIRRLKATGDSKASKYTKNGSSPTANPPVERDNQPAVIDINHLSSDIEDDLAEYTGNDDGEIVLLANRTPASTQSEDQLCSNRLSTYKARYRGVVHALRKLKDDYRLDKFHLESEAKKLTDQITTLKEELEDVKKQLSSANNSPTASLESDRKSNSSSPHQSSKQINKIRDLEKLMAKCKESLKTKNAQLTILKKSLNEVEKFKEDIDELKGELHELKNAHETWTLSIAENKRVMHQEIEEKNAEIESIKLQLKESTNRFMQQKSNIQSLESRLVSMSAAHQKERESLIKELINAKNSAIKRVQREHELHLERVKLDLEKSIEALKSDILTRDEQIIRGGQRQKELEERNCILETDLESFKRRCNEHLNNVDQLNSEKQKHLKKIEELENEVNEHKKQFSGYDDLKGKNEALEKEAQELRQQVTDLNDETSRLKETNDDLCRQLDAAKSNIKQDNEQCSNCLDLQSRLNEQSENHEQSLFEVTTKLDLMTTANADQEKALTDLKKKHEAALEDARISKIECEELCKKNESLSQVLRDNESEMQAQQDQFEKLKQKLETLRSDNSSLTLNLSQTKNELAERTGELVKLQENIDKMKERIKEVEEALKVASAESENLRKEKESLMLNLEAEFKKRKDVDQQIVLNILAALKNLETPETSPGSDKSYQPDNLQSDVADHDHNLPDPVKLAKNLSSIALDRSNAYVTANQRLQAVLLDNTMINEEVKRLRDEINALSEQKTHEIMASLEEVERLRTENQALIHDQKAYDDHISVLEADIKSLKQKLSEIGSAKNQIMEISTQTVDERNEIAEELARKNNEIEQLKELIEKSKRDRSSLHQAERSSIPSSTEFEYLKNIVYQFLIGREPITLARVISAIFKFDKEQMEQICKFQEAIHQVTS